MLRTGDWLWLQIAGEPFFDKAPLFLWVAAGFTKLFGAILPVHDAGRLACGFCMACTLALLSLTSLELIGERAMRLGVLLFIGCLGLLIRAHEMTTALAGLTGVALGLYGITLAARAPKRGGLVAVAGLATAFLGNGFLSAGMLLALMALLPASGAAWRARGYGVTVELAALPRGGASALDWFGVTPFFLCAAIRWVGWVAAMTGNPEVAAAWLAREVPDYRYKFSYIACALAALLTLIWLAVVARSLRSPRRALVNWAAGITMVWMLAMTLGLPLIDQAKSYRAVALRIVAAMPQDFTCIARQNLGEAQRALLDYFAGITTIRVEYPAASRCNALLVQTDPGNIPAVGPEWSEVWRGSRPGDRNELFILYRRQAGRR